MSTHATTPSPSPEPSPTPAPTPTPTPAPSDWRQGLPSDLRENPLTQKYETPEEFVRGAIEAQGLLGRKGVPLPKEGDAEDRVRFVRAVGESLGGYPESADAYDLGDFQPPEGLPWDADMQGQVLRIAHAAGLSQDQVRGVLRGYAEAQGQQWNGLIQNLNAAEEAVEQKLKQEWGAAYDAKIEAAVQAMDELFGPEGRKQLDAITGFTGERLGGQEAFIRAMVRIGEGMGEHGLGTSRGKRLTQTPGEAQRAAERFDLEHAEILQNKSHPLYRETLERREQLYEAAYRDAPTQDKDLLRQMGFDE